MTASLIHEACICVYKYVYMYARMYVCTYVCTSHMYLVFWCDLYFPTNVCTQFKQFKSDFEAERAGHVQTAKDRDNFKKRCEQLSDELKRLQSSQQHTPTPVNLSYMYKSEEDDQRRGGQRLNQPSYTDFPRY